MLPRRCCSDVDMYSGVDMCRGGTLWNKFYHLPTPTTPHEFEPVQKTPPKMHPLCRLDGCFLSCMYELRFSSCVLFLTSHTLLLFLFNLFLLGESNSTNKRAFHLSVVTSSSCYVHAYVHTPIVLLIEVYICSWGTYCSMAAPSSWKTFNLI